MSREKVKIGQSKNQMVSNGNILSKAAHTSQRTNDSFAPINGNPFDNNNNTVDSNIDDNDNKTTTTARIYHTTSTPPQTSQLHGTSHISPNPFTFLLCRTFNESVHSPQHRWPTLLQYLSGMMPHAGIICHFITAKCVSL
jgi:hypothetical protein